MKKRLLIITLIASLVSQPVSAFNSFYSDNDILTYDKDAAGVCTQGSSNASGSSVDLGNVPDPWKSLILQTAPLYPTADARLVAATLWAENRGWPDYNKNWGVSSAGAAGPWQFIPSTWASLGTDGDNDGVKDRNNPKDAVHAAFKHQLGSAGKPIIEGYNGDLSTGLSLIFRRAGKPSLLAYMANYNGLGAPENTPLNGFPRNENSDYVIMGYYLLASNFSKAWMPSTATVVDATTTNSTQTGTNNTSSCNSATGYVDTNGYAFPVGLKKSLVSNGYKWPCDGICHHDGSAAFDLAHKDTVSGGVEKDNLTVGVPVYAIVNGKIQSIRDNYRGQAGCYSFQLVGDDGWKYWYGHIANPTVQEGQTVSAGEKIAEIGQRRCTGNGSYPHLHIDRGYPKGTIGGNDTNRDLDFIPLVNELYEGLPNE